MKVDRDVAYSQPKSIFIMRPNVFAEKAHQHTFQIEFSLSDFSFHADLTSAWDGLCRIHQQNTSLVVQARMAKRGLTLVMVTHNEKLAAKPTGS